MQTDCFPDSTASWPKGPMSELAVVNPRYPTKKGRDYPFVEMASVGENFAGIIQVEVRSLEGSGLSRFKVGDTLFAKITPCPQNGKIAFVATLPGAVGLGSTEFIVLSPRPGAMPRFVYHLACSHAVRGRAAARMEGSTGRQRVPEEVFTKRLLVPLPDLDEQVAIARILDAVDTALERTRAAVERARELRKSLLAELLSGGFGADGKVRRAHASVGDFMQTPLGKLPAAWRLSAVAHEFELQNGFTLNADRRARFKRRRYLRVANVQREALDLSDVQELEAGDAEFAPRVLQVDDLLVVEGHADRMQIGRCARVTPEAGGVTFQNHLFRLRTNGAVVPAFACLWLNSAYAQRYWNARCATSSGLNTINQRMLKRLAIPVPSQAEQHTIAELAQRQRQHVAALVAKQERIEALKKSLMHDLLTGRVRVRDTSKVAAS
jgi:type I restriction enzyme S subunit